jgi:hypothetical protein
MSEIVVDNGKALLIRGKSSEKSFAERLQLIIQASEEIKMGSRIWYEPLGDDEHFDFALFTPKHGLVLIEVKGFDMSQVDKWDHKSISYRLTSGRKTYRFNRLRTYQIQFSNLLKKYSIPVSKMYVFTGMTSFEVSSKYTLEARPNQNELMFADDLINASTFLNKLNGLPEYNYVHKSLHVDFVNKYLTGSQGQMILEEVMEKHIDGSDDFPIDDRIVESSDNVFHFDQTQFFLVEDHLIKKPGYRYLKGPAGSGKTVMLKRAVEKIAEYFPNLTILLTYYMKPNAVHYDGLRRFSNVKVAHFDDLCYGYLDVRRENMTDEQYGEKVLGLFQGKNKNKIGSFDYIFIDEAQDFPLSWAEIVFMLASGVDHRDKKVRIAYDDAQNLNADKRKSTTLEAFRGKLHRDRIKKLSIIYRTPKSIIDVVGSINEEVTRDTRCMEEIYSLDVENRVRYVPWTRFEDFADSIEKIVSGAVDKLGVNYHDIVVIYPSFFKRSVRDFCSPLFRKDGPFEFRDRDVHGANYWRIAPDKVNFIGSNPGKGQEFSVVILLWFDKMEDSLSNRNHFYTSATRTTKFLFILHEGLERNGLLRLLPELTTKER